MLSRNRQAAQRRGWSHGGEPLSLTTWPGCARRPPFRQRTSPETETRKAEPANKSLIDRRLSAPSPTLCSQLQFEIRPAVSRNARALPRPLTSDIRVSRPSPGRGAMSETRRNRTFPSSPQNRRVDPMRTLERSRWSVGDRQCCGSFGDGTLDAAPERCIPRLALDRHQMTF